jgi:hypothetical protein
MKHSFGVVIREVWRVVIRTIDSFSVICQESEGGILVSCGGGVSACVMKVSRHFVGRRNSEDKSRVNYGLLEWWRYRGKTEV